MTRFERLRRMAGAVGAIVLLVGTMPAPARAAEPPGVHALTVASSTFRPPRAGADAATRIPKRVLQARATFGHRLAEDHARDVSGSIAPEQVLAQGTAPGRGSTHPAAPAAAGAGDTTGDASGQAAAPAAVAEGMSALVSSRFVATDMMAASPSYIMQAGATYIGSYPRANQPDELPVWAIETFLGLPASQAGYGSTVAWDQAHGRWVVAGGAWEYDESSCNEGYIVLAVSAGENPSGTWTRWRIPLGATSVDGLSLGLSDTLIALGGNEYPLDPGWVACLGLPFSGARVRTLDWSDVLDGGAITVKDLTPSQPRRSWSYRLARNTPVGDATSAGEDIALLVDRFDGTTGLWGDLAFGSITGSAVAGTAALALTDLTATGLPRLGGPPWLGASPGYRLNGDWLGEGSGIDEAIQSIARRGDRLIATAAASCAPAGDGVIKACLRVITLGVGVGTPTIEDDTLLGDSWRDTYLGAAGFARDGTTFAMFDRGNGTAVTWRPAGALMSAPQPVTDLEEGQSAFPSSWASQAVVVPDPVDAGVAWSTLAVPELGVYGPVVAMRGGLSAPPTGDFTLPEWSHNSVPLRLTPAPDSPITRVYVSGSPTISTWNGHDFLANPSTVGVSASRLYAGIGSGDGPRTVYVQWITADGIPSPIVSHQTTVDDTGPSVTATRSYVVPQTVGSSVAMRWSVGGTDAGIGIDGWDSWLNNAEGLNTTRHLTPAAPAFAIAAKLGLDYHFDVIARDKLGNTSQESLYQWAKSRLVQNSSSGVKYGGTWATRAATSASGGSVKSTTTKATATMRVTGVAFGIVVTKGPGRGRFSVSVDGGPATVVDTWRSSTAYRQLVWQASTWNGTHTVKITALATSGRPRVDLDAFVVMEDGWGG